MAEVLAVVGLVGNIIAFVDFAQKVASRLNEFSGDLKDVPKSLQQIQAQLPLITDGIRRLEDRVNSGKLDIEAQTALGPVILQCRRKTERLSEILDNILPAPDASSWDRRVKAIRSLARGREVEEISEALGRYMSTLTFYTVIEEIPTNKDGSGGPATAMAESTSTVQTLTHLSYQAKPPSVTMLNHLDPDYPKQRIIDLKQNANRYGQEYQRNIEAVIKYYEAGGTPPGPHNIVYALDGRATHGTTDSFGVDARKADDYVHYWIEYGYSRQ